MAHQSQKIKKCDFEKDEKYEKLFFILFATYVFEYFPIVFLIYVKF